MEGQGGGSEEGSGTVDDIRSEIRPLGVKDLKRNGVKAVQLNSKPLQRNLKINEAKNGGFEVEIFVKRSACNVPMEEDQCKKRMSHGRRMLL